MILKFIVIILLTNIVICNATIYTVTLPLVKVLQNATSTTTTTFDVSDEMLKDFKVPLEQLKKSKIQETASGGQILVLQDGQTINMDVKEEQVVVEEKQKKELNLEEYLSKVTFENLKDDPTLRPVQHLKINHNSRIKSQCVGNTVLDLQISYRYVNVKVNNKSIYEINPSNSSEDSGLIVLVFNTETCQITSDQVYNLGYVPIYRDLKWFMNTINVGRLIIMLKLDESFDYFYTSARDQLSSYGSLYSTCIGKTDFWTLVFVKGRGCLLETLSPGKLEMQKNVNIHAAIDKSSLDYDCKNWLNGNHWQVRHTLCQMYDGYQDLCDCENPFIIFNKTDTGAQIPIFILSNGRGQYLFRLLQTLSGQPGISSELILIVSDTYDLEVSMLAYILGLKILEHKPEGSGGTRISRILRFALYNTLQEFPDAEAVISLEDDMVVSKDFYSYMRNCLPLFKMDPTISSVSSFFSFSTESGINSSRIYRTSQHPSHGWMMAREVVVKLLPKWIPAGMKHDWDYFLDTLLTGTNTIAPEMARTLHVNTEGLHLGPSWFNEKYFLRKKLNDEENAKIQDLKSITKEEYEENIRQKILKAVPLQINENTIKTLQNITYNNGTSKIMNPTIIYYSQRTKWDQDALQVLADLLGTRGRQVISHYDPITFSSFGHDIFLVGVPLSKYSYLMPKNYIIFTTTQEILSELTNKLLSFTNLDLVTVTNSCQSLYYN